MAIPSRMDQQGSNPAEAAAEGASRPAAELADESPLRLRNCPRCDYPLIGLPAVGNCPECGLGFNQINVFLYGFATDRQRAWSGAPLTTRQLVWTGLALLAGGIWMFHFVRAPEFGVLIWFGVLAVEFGFHLWRRTVDVGSGVVQVALGPAGVCQRTRHLVGLPYAGIENARWIPWRKLGSVKTKPVGNGRIRLVISSNAPWWAFRRVYVHANVACTPEALAALLRRVDQWRAAAEA